MIAYVDSSVLLRIVLGEPGRLAAWGRIERAVSSELIRVECLRTIDRARVRIGLKEEDVAYRRSAVLAALEGFEIAPLDAQILVRAADPFPTTVGTLDAVHLSTAIQLRTVLPHLVLATHDGQLATAARAVGFRVVGA